MNIIQTTGDLFENYAAIMVKGGKMPKAEIEESFRGIIALYQETHRHYHNLDHIKELHLMQHSLGVTFKDPDAVHMAILLHDVIYTPSRAIPGKDKKTNEVMSAEYAEKLLTRAGFDNAFINRVSQLIRYTEKHDCPDEDTDAQLFIDLDMSIIGRDQQRYQKYAMDVAKEFLTVYEPKEYSIGRAGFLFKFLHNERIFKTDLFHNKFDGPARRNAQWELDNLEKITLMAAEKLPPRCTTTAQCTTSESALIITTLQGPTPWNLYGFRSVTAACPPALLTPPYQ